MNTIYLVVPCYNEEEVLRETASRLKDKMQWLIRNKVISDKSRITFVDDGSKDKTWSIIEELNSNDKIFSGVKLSRNRGHQNALLAGLMTVKGYCDAAISLDADLQDDINVIDKFIEKFNYGCDVVYGVRSERKTDTVFKRTTAQGFYKIMKALGVDIVYNHADYRLMSKRALDSLQDFKEVNLFLRGIVPLIGYKSDVVLYERNERFAGESKYPLKKMLSFAFEGITSFSVKPIRLILIVGILMFISSLAAILYFLIIWMAGKTVQGWTTVVASIWMLGGIQLLCLGVIGEYIGKIYIESKERPKYIIDKFINE
ncbi:glycosyltransferase family 2 protein [uncultured Clostridium sp.]|uniref:glycosyltransferase family 2 protein n=1 Tax=uncultured Clostridium sp. TaxID=59620 RepID=UPI0025FD71C4|nr:glycosyltransferase family 2 protein [uncultured Clostridium sp.]MDU4884551.1 glycosyltransferase family 2 protein [Clostridium celatum]MDU7077720.1 glycosyltransferase family 2 protein [Clostridium celatum]